MLPRAQNTPRLRDGSAEAGQTVDANRDPSARVQAAIARVPKSEEEEEMYDEEGNLIESPIDVISEDSADEETNGTNIENDEDVEL